MNGIKWVAFRDVLGMRWCVVGVGLLVFAAHALGTDQPIIAVSRAALVPSVIEVHEGELVRWQAPGGEHLHLRLDAHPGAHGAVVRSGEIRTMFILPGVHTHTKSS